MTEVEFLAWPEKIIPEATEARYCRLIQRRLSGVPLARITRRKEFWSLTFHMLPGVFIPRPETELIVEKALERSSGGDETIVDIGTGSGNIALSLARELPRARIIAVDVSARALASARLNALQQGCEHVTFLKSSLFSAFRGLGLEEQCDFIVSNPPYVSAADWAALPGEIRNHEPRRALVGGKTGLEFIGRLIRGSWAYLRPGAPLLFEIGLGQAEKVLSLFDRRWVKIESFADLRGISRVIKAGKA
jgi:release factor glutamine methyltransferase